MSKEDGNMESGYPKGRKFVPLLMEWVEQNREYLIPKLTAYSNRMFYNLKPVIYAWCINSNMEQTKFQLRLFSQTQCCHAS